VAARQFGLRLVRPVLRPVVIHETLALLFTYLHKFHKQLFPIRIFASRNVFPVELGFVGMHDHPWMHVVDPEIVFAVRTVFQGLNNGGGIGLELVFGHLQIHPGADDPVPGLE